MQIILSRSIYTNAPCKLAFVSEIAAVYAPDRVAQEFYQNKCMVNVTSSSCDKEQKGGGMLQNAWRQAIATVGACSYLAVGR